MDRAALQERFGILGHSPTLTRVLDRVRLVARTDVTVLLQGESGAGEELVAQAIHGVSARRHRPLVVVNCGAIPEGLIESELFGAEKGAYTGSVERRTGFFEEAAGGTIFLDEIGETPPQAQVRLLRVLETGQFSRVGSSQARTSDARVIAATNRDLGREVAAGRFREDLYYRLSTVLIQIPPLRERREDITLLFERFLRTFAERYGSGPRRLTPDAERLLAEYAWPGNVRELRNVAEQAVVLAPGDRTADVTADALRPYLRGVSAGGASAGDVPAGGAVPASMGLVPVARPSAAPPAPDDRELIYRALLEMRLDLRDLKEQVGTLVTAVQVTREDIEHARPAPRGEGFVIVRADPSGPPAARGPEPDDEEFEDAAYELAGDGGPDDAPAASEETMPTLEAVERDLIARALRLHDGNRRRAAAALGISERTLYRKIKEMEEAL